jgi:hypothetical protein
MAVSVAEITDKEKADRIKEIKTRAKKVYDFSFNYHLIHALFGSDGLLLCDRKEYKAEETKEIFNAAFKAIQEGDALLAEKIKKDGEILKKEFQHRKYCILVEYIPMDDIHGGRVVIADDKLKISLPEKLQEGLIDEEGKLNSAPISKLREIMAHELGHIVLHTEKIPPDIRGSKGLAPLDWEAEVFAEELLLLYEKQDHRLEVKP